MPARRRIFIAINLPENIKEELLSYKEKWPELPVKWTKKENLHITLVFLGHISEQEVGETCTKLKETACQYNSFPLTLKRICCGPPKKIPPKMVWAEGEKSEELSKLHGALENRPYTPHITLGRINTWEWRRLEPEERPQVEEDINLKFQVKSIEVMESQLRKGGPEYTILESALLK